MTARTPLKLVNDGTAGAPNWNIQQVTSAELTAIINQTAYLYGTDPSVHLNVSATNLPAGDILSQTPLSDTRLIAGNYASNTRRYPTEAETAEPSTVTVGYQKIYETTESVSAPTDTASKAFPCYLDGSDNIRAMSRTDFYDTFVKPAIDILVGSGDQPGTYRIHTSTSLTDHTNISTTPVFKDTRANTSLYTGGGIPETLDQPQDITNYYMMRTDAVTEYTYPKLLQINSDNDIQEYTNSALETILLSGVRYCAVNLTNYKIRYNIDGSGNNKGSGMTDTKLDGDGLRTTRFVNADDYRAQEFPDGTAQTINTYRLRIYKET